MPNVTVEGVPHQPNYAPGMTFNMGITTGARDPGKILEWYDWALSEEGEFYYYFGIEGLNYVMENGIVTYPFSVVPISYKHRYLLNVKGRIRAVYESMPYGDIVTAVYDAAINDTRYHDTMMMPDSIYNGYEDYAPYRATLFRDRVARMISGRLPMSAWDDYVAEWYANGGTGIQRRVTRWYRTTNNLY
jgi:putative aldouronate transport system substrate-binding protein